MHESCSKCIPCREGTAWAHKILDKINSHKSYNQEDINQLLELSH